MSPRRNLSLFLLLSLLAAVSLGADEPVRVDRYGDPLPPQALARLGTVRFRHGNGIRSLAYSPNGKFLASGGIDQKIRLWEAQSGRLVYVFEGHIGAVHKLAFSPDSKLLVSAGDMHVEEGDIRLWNVATGKLVFHLKQEVTRPPKAVAFSSNGRFVQALAFPGDRRFVPPNSPNEVRIWDTETGKRTRHLALKDPDGQVFSIAFTNDGKIMAAVAPEGSIRFWDLQQGKEIPRKKNPKGAFPALAFSPDGTIIAAATNDSIRLYLSATMEEIKQLKGQNAPTRLMIFSPDGKTLLSDAGDESLSLWDLDSGKQIRQIPNPNGRIGNPTISPDGTTVATSGKGVIRLWNLQTGTERRLPGGNWDPAGNIAFLRDGKSVVSIVDRSQAVVWPGGMGKESRQIEVPVGSEQCLLCPDRSTLAITTAEGRLFLLEMSSGKELNRLSMSKGAEISDISRNQNRAAFWFSDAMAGDGHLEVWDLTTKKALQRFDRNYFCQGFLGDGQHIALSNRAQFRIWSLDTKKEVFHSDRSGFYRLAFSPNGRMIAITDGDNFQLLETATGKERLRMQGHSGQVSSLAFSSDGKTLASGSMDQTVRLWDVYKGKELHGFHGHFGGVMNVDFSPDNSRLVSSSEDTTALIWEIPIAVKDRKPVAMHLGREEQAKLWGTLASSDATASYAALQRLALAPAEAVSLCQVQLLKPPATPPEQIRRWITQLDDKEYEVREQASRNLENVEIEAEHALQTALKGKCSPEARRRMEALLEILKGKDFGIRPLRAVELLEQVGTAKAADILRELEKKTGDAALRDDVRRSLRRLARNGGTP